MSKKKRTQTAKIITILAVLLLCQAAQQTEAFKGMYTQVPESARMFSLKLATPLNASRLAPANELGSLGDIVVSLRNWRSKKNHVSFEQLINSWIRENASTPEAKCQAHYYRGYSFAFQFLQNLQKLNLGKEEVRGQLMKLVNGQVNIGKSTFLAEVGKSMAVTNNIDSSLTLSTNMEVTMLPGEVRQEDVYRNMEEGEALDLDDHVGMTMSTEDLVDHFEKVVGDLDDEDRETVLQHIQNMDTINQIKVEPQQRVKILEVLKTLIKGRFPSNRRKSGVRGRVHRDRNALPAGRVRRRLRPDRPQVRLSMLRRGRHAVLRTQLRAVPEG